ncbi:MAG: CopD family protein [Gammaproteobacteria bacterium]|nr:CopD family protein [Gammaproteobacteria bacterium]MBL6999453.1 CopD family protein [Gammaproteobacteria bacterium]
MGIYLALHVLSIIIWVGGMFFAYMILRPAAASLLEPAVRLNLWRQVFSRFFPWVWASIVLVPLTGIALTTPYGGFAHTPPHIHIMTTLGVIMMLIFMHVYFAPFKRIKKCLDAADIPGAAKQLNTLRILVGINTIIGLITVIVATAGKYFLL